MADLEEEFQSETVESNQGKFELIPVGTEVAMIAVNSDMKTTNDFQGKYINWEFHLCDPPYENRKIFQNMTWKNASQKAEAIGRAQFADLCRATKQLNPTDTAQLHNVHFIGRVGIEKGKNNYPDKNKVIAFYAIGEDGLPIKPKPQASASAQAPAPAAPAPQAPRAQAAAPARPLQPTATGKPAWQRPAAQPARAPA